MRPARLRGGEWLVGICAVALLVLMFVACWYRARFAIPAATGWHGLIHVRWLVLVTAVLGLLLVGFQAGSRAPAVPVSLSVILTVVGLLDVLWLGYRVLISVPPGETAWAYVGFACAVGILVGAIVSLRTEGISTRDQPQQIPTVRLPGHER